MHTFISNECVSEIMPPISLQSQGQRVWERLMSATPKTNGPKIPQLCCTTLSRNQGNKGSIETFLERPMIQKVHQTPKNPPSVLDNSHHHPIGIGSFIPIARSSHPLSSSEIMEMTNQPSLVFNCPTIAPSSTIYDRKCYTIIFWLNTKGSIVQW